MITIKIDPENRHHYYTAILNDVYKNNDATTQLSAQVKSTVLTGKTPCGNEMALSPLLAYLFRLALHGGVLHGCIHAAEPRGLRRGRAALGGGLARRVHQLPIRVSRVVGRKPSRQILSDAHLKQGRGDRRG